MKNQHPWPDADIATLRRLWDEGLSTAAIGRVIGVSKDSVVGKAHRLDLPSRPSPIHPAKAPKPQRAPKMTLVGVVLPDTSPVTMVPLGAYGCRFPMWGFHERAGKDPRFCEVPRVPGKSYCGQHQRLCYVRREEMAA